MRSGAPLINPNGSPEQKEFAVKYAELRKASDAASFKAAGASAGAASGGATVPTQSWDSVDDWR